jgi:hypothetical protein
LNVQTWKESSVRKKLDILFVYYEKNGHQRTTFKVQGFANPRITHQRRWSTPLIGRQSERPFASRLPSTRVINTLERRHLRTEWAWR